MPYIVTGYDSAGVRHEYVMDDAGAVTASVPGDEPLTGWLGENPFEKPEPIEGETAPASGEMTPSQLEAMRQHVSKLLTVVQIAPAPEADVRGTAQAPTDPATRQPPGTATTTTPRRYTTTELEAMTVTDLRSLAVAAQIAGAASMPKAELVTAIQAHQRSASER